MLNQVILVGRLTEDLELNKNDDKVQVITLAVPRSYKNAEGIYETDFIDCVLNGKIFQNVSTYCKKGDIIGIKGRLQQRYYEIDGNNISKLELMTEKVSFLQLGEQNRKNINDIEVR